MRDEERGIYSGFISVMLLTADRSSLTLVLLLTTELCTVHIYLPVRAANSSQVRENWPCSVWS